MCKCNPEIRTPFCGAVGCEWPEITDKEKIDKLTIALEVAEKALKYMTEDYDCDPEDVALYDRRKALEALAQINKIKKGEL